MGLFSKLTEKKICDICGGQIGLMGNRKLEDGNLCKECASKLSPWFSDRRSSTVQQIREQLEYREANREAVAAFHTTRSLGGNTKLLLDEDAGKFMVTRARDLAEANPDVLSFSQVTGVEVRTDEHKSEERHKDMNGRMVSYQPPRYEYSYDFDVVIRVNHPYFDEISFQLNPSSISTTTEAVPESKAPNPRLNREYREYEAMGREIRTALTNARTQVRKEAEAAAAPKAAATCPHCGAPTIPDANNCCEYCGGALV